MVTAFAAMCMASTTRAARCGKPPFWTRPARRSSGAAPALLETADQKLNHLAQERTPAAHNVSTSTIDEFLNPSHNGDYSNDEATLQSSAGLIRVFEYNTSGDCTGELIKQGRTGTAYYVAASDYYGGSNVNRMHLVTARYNYPSAETSRTAASRITTEYSYTFWSGTDTVDKRTATLPTSRAVRTARDRPPRPKNTTTTKAACGGRRMRRAT